ncbi:MAG: Fe-S cluster assembly sulfur transfer protein SufU [Candidatus Nanopelagicales bacterium]
MDALYQEIILDHYRNPVGKGLREPFQSQVHHVNPTCGDEITLRVNLRGDAERPVVADVSYDNQGCSISQAAASVMYELVEDQPLGVAQATQEQFLTLMQSAASLSEADEEALGDAMAFSGVSKFPARVKCALLPWLALKDALVQAQACLPGARQEVNG